MPEPNWDTKDDLAFQVLTVDKPDFGTYEDSLTTPQLVDGQVNRIIAETETPIGVSPEVHAPQSLFGGQVQLPVPEPRVRRVTPEPGQTDGESKQHVAQFHKLELKAEITREPNRWDVFGGHTIPAPSGGDNGVRLGWSPRIGRSLVTIRNTGSNTVYVAPVQEKLLGSKNRGLSIAANSSYDFSTEAAGWVLSPSGTTIDIIEFWYEDEDARPPDFSDD